MGKNPGVDSQHLIADAAARKVASTYLVGCYRYVNPYNPSGVLITPQELEALWRELLALVRRRPTPSRGR